MGKKGVSVVAGNIRPTVGEKTTYRIVDWYQETPKSDRNPALVTWELFKKRSNGKFTTTKIKKNGVGDFTFGEGAAGQEYRLEAYLHQPEGGGLIIKPQPNKVPQILKVELQYVDDTPGKVFSFTEKVRARAHCSKMLHKEVLFTLWEDDAPKAGHNPKNLVIETRKAKVNKNGVAVAEFMLTKALMKKAMEGEADVKQVEFYVTVEYFPNKKHATGNVNIDTLGGIYIGPPKPAPAPPKEQPKAKGSPAEQKGKSKKEEKGIIETVREKVGGIMEIIGKTISDFMETKGTIKKEKEPAVQKPESKNSPATVRENNNLTCICKETKLFWGKFFNCQERKKIIEISRRLMCDPNHLTSAMALETGGKFDPSIVNSLGYTGLIQIGSTAAEDINKRKGTKITAGKNGTLKDMSKLDQLTYVEYYLEPFKGKLNTLADFYLSILMPIDCGRGNDRNHIVFDKNIALDYNKKGEVIKNSKWIRQGAYAQNPVFHKEGKNEDGKTYVWEVAKEIQKWHDKGEMHKATEFSCQNSEPNQKEEKQSGKWHDPVNNPRLTKYNYSGIIKPSSGTYGWCRRNSDGSKKYHSGFDFFAIPGKDKVYACLKGNVSQVRYSSSAGWIVRIKIQNVKDLLEQEKSVNYTNQFTDELKGTDIKETDDVYFIYMHLDSVVVTEEDAANKKEVDAGTVLGYAGVSGSIASGGRAPHLHLEIATVLDAYGKGESVRTNPARFVKLNSYDTIDQDEAAKITHYYNKK